MEDLASTVRANLLMTSEMTFDIILNFSGGYMSYSHVVSFFLMIALLMGCSTTTIVKDARNAEIKITSTGEISYRDQTITKEQIPDLFRDNDVKRDETIYILVPANQQQRDYLLMRSITDTLKRAGYGRIIFNTDKKATAILKEATTQKP